MEHSLYILFLIVVYGLSVQQGIEFVDTALPFGLWKRNKKLFCKTVAFLIGAALFELQSRFFLLHTIEIVICAFSVAAAAELWNSVLKILVYTKEQSKATAGQMLSTSGSLAIQAMAKK
jgi:hypothetical protein